MHHVHSKGSAKVKHQQRCVTFRRMARTCWVRAVDGVVLYSPFGSSPYIVDTQSYINAGGRIFCVTDHHPRPDIGPAAVLALHYAALFLGDFIRVMLQLSRGCAQRYAIVARENLGVHLDTAKLLLITSRPPAWIIGPIIWASGVLHSNTVPELTTALTFVVALTFPTCLGDVLPTTFC